MEHVGIDLAAKRSNVVVMDASGEVIERRAVPTSELPSWLRRRPPSRVVMESCTQSPAIATAAKQAGHEVAVISGHLVRQLGVGARGIKTDDRDAYVLAEASVRIARLPSVHIRSDVSRSHRELLSARATLVEMRKKLAVSVKSWLRGRLVSVSGRGNSKAFADAVRRVALEHPDGLPMAIEVLLQEYEQLHERICLLDEEIEKLAANNEIATRLMTVPGVGPVISLAFVTQIDDISRFDSAEQLASYLALVPGEATTGGRLRRTGTIVAGPKYLKALLVQAAWVMWRTRPNDPLVLRIREIAERRNSRVAIVALARKIASVLYAMWKRGTPYDPSLPSTARAKKRTSEPSRPNAAASQRKVSGSQSQPVL